ncbi:MAG: hypothetical protein U0Y96_10205 [Candidatus Kapaibacterium sp.]
MKSRNLTRLLKLNNERFWYRKRSEYIHRFLRNGAILSDIVVKYYHLERYLKENKESKLKSENKYFHIKNTCTQLNVPITFSFFTNPSETAKFIQTTYKVSYKAVNNHLHLNHRPTEEVCIASTLLFDNLLHSAIKIKRLKGLSGYLSQSSIVNNFLLRTGVLFRLNYQPKAKDYEQGLFTGDIKNPNNVFKATGSAKEPKAASLAAYGLAEYLIRLASNLPSDDKNFDVQTMSTLAEAIGEIICNAEEHASGKWFVFGDYDDETQICSFAILNYGDITIYSALQKSQNTKDKGEQFYRRLVANAVSKSGYNKEQVLTEIPCECVWNLYALQEGVSSKKKRKDIERATRGRGLPDFISYVRKISNPCKECLITIISGKSQLLIDNSCIIYDSLSKKQGVGNHKGNVKVVRHIPLNGLKNIYEPPTKGKMYIHDYNLKGTLIACQFHLNVSNSKVQYGNSE